MILIAFTFIFLLTLGFIVVLQFNFQVLKKQHIEQMNRLQLTAQELIKNQNDLHEKIAIMESFDTHYKEAKLQLNQEVLSLVHHALNKISEKKP